MKIGVGLGSQLEVSYEELFALARPAAECGFDSIWTNNRRIPDPFHLCLEWADEAAKSSVGRIDAGIAVVPVPQNWNPASLIIQAASLSELSSGHFILGIGTGGYGAGFWDSIGLANRPIAIMHEYIEAFRVGISGGSSYEGEFLKLQDLSLESHPNVPIYLAALGPQMLRLAGRCADGVISDWGSLATMRRASELVTEGAREAGRQRGDISLALHLRCCIDEDVDAARRVIATEILRKLDTPEERRAKVGSHGHRAQFLELGFADEVETLEARLRAGESATTLVESVSHEFCCAAGYFGPANEAPHRIAEMTAGLDEVILRILTTEPGTAPVRYAMDALAPEKIRNTDMVLRAQR